VVAAAGVIRVLVADDHPLYRDGIVRAIRQRAELELVGEAVDGRQALDAIRDLAPDVAVLDIKMPELDGLQVLNAVSREQLATRVLVLAAAVDGALVFEAIAAGAAAYLSKAADRQQICEAIVAVGRGETVLSPEAQAGIASETRTRGRTERPHLTAREHEVLVLVADGLAAPEIAKRLFVSTATVKGHLQNLYEKLGVSERAAAVAEALRRGLLE
jgi:two-component system, NarL family, nitrate/nitrite response regulator NarL